MFAKSRQRREQRVIKAMCQNMQHLNEKIRVFICYIKAEGLTIVYSFANKRNSFPATPGMQYTLIKVENPSSSTDVCQSRQSTFVFSHSRGDSSHTEIQ